MSDVSKVAHVAGAKTARACDGCIRKRARWFCAADDAFLCQSCDSKVHSANPVSRRHERVRLKTASLRSQIDDGGNENENVVAPRVTRSVPSWHSRKARTPRGKLQSSSGFKSTTSEDDDDVVRNLFYLVPEVMSDDTTRFDEQLLYGRVPILADSASENKLTSSFGANEVKGFVGNFYNEVGFVPSEMDLEEFAADVESLLGKGLDDDESFGIDGVGLSLGLMAEVDGSSMMDTISMRCSSGRILIKDEDAEKEEEVEEIEMDNEEVIDLGFEYNEEEEIDEKVKVVFDDEEKMVLGKKGKILLRLDYESILSAWDGSSPWAAGERPDVDPNDHCWPTCMATCQIESHQLHSADHAAYVNGRIRPLGDGGREARVSRYREKRRTRLFSKKIRYEVRKLNAEKRPRMKGRFVKRPLSSFPPTSSLSLFS